MLRRPVLRPAAAVLLAVAVLGACTENPDPTPVSGATVPPPSEPGTLLPTPDDTQPSDLTSTVPAGALFGGDPCTALHADDVAATRIDGRTGARLRDTAALSPDACEFDIAVGSRSYVVVVQAASADEFAAPGGTSFEVRPVDGVGLDAKGVDLGDRVEVYVQVANGYFSVTAPDEASATALARVAADHASTPP